ncbi:MAG: glycosyltransferase family 39 protein [Candidatus Niyogibacteria bacterium]|nr:glycosyltransferase family 39 protein [Candidatus Niyogibacteria bacterium]
MGMNRLRFSWFLSTYRDFIVLFFLCLIINSIVFSVTYSRGNLDPRRLTTDAREYYTLATNMVERGVFSRMEQAPFIPDRFRTPAYPLVVGAFAKVFGGIGVLLVFQIFLSYISAIGVYWITDFLWNSRSVALIAGSAFLSNPLVFILANSVFSETVFLFLLIFGVYYFLRYLRSNSTRLFMLAMALFSFAALTRPIALYLVFAALGYSVLVRFNFKKLVLNTFLFAVIFSAVLFPWSLRNKLIFGDWHFTTADIINMYYLHIGQLYAWQNDISFHDAMETLSAMCTPAKLSENFDGKCVNIEMRRLFMPLLSEIEPATIAKYAALGSIRYFFNDGFTEFGNWLCRYQCPVASVNIIDALANGGPSILSIMKSKPPVLLSMWIVGKAIWSVIFLSLGFLAWNGRRYVVQREPALFLLMILGYFFLFSIPAWTIRYRVPFDTFIFVFAAAGFWHLKGRVVHYVRHQRI